MYVTLIAFYGNSTNPLSHNEKIFAKKIMESIQNGEKNLNEFSGSAQTIIKTYIKEHNPELYKTVKKY